MAEVAVHDLCDHEGEILNRIAGGEAMIITREGVPIAELRPLPRRPIPAGVLLRRRRHLPAIDPVLLRVDIDKLADVDLVKGAATTAPAR